MGKLVQMMDPRDDQKVYPYPGFPVGAIYMSMNNTNPSTYFGGTWSLIAPGRVLVGVDASQTEFNIVRKSGGHKLMQQHDHIFTNKYGNVNTGGTWAALSSYNNAQAPGTSGMSTQLTGGGDSQNLQPYLTCYIWERTA